MNRFSITLAAATVSALALIIGAPVGAHANTYACGDNNHNEWTLTTDTHSDKSSFWQNIANSGVREGTYMVTEGYTIVRFYDGWMRIAPTGAGDWNLGKLSGTITCLDKSAPVVANAPAPTAVPPVVAPAPAVATALGSVPISFNGMGAEVAVSVGTMPVTMVVDTGAQTLTVTETVANWLLSNGQATRGTTSDKFKVAGGEQKEFKSVEINTINVAGHELHKVHANVVPDGASMLLGLPILAGLTPKIAIDFTNATMTFN